jgi:hypothetical protein
MLSDSAKIARTDGVLSRVLDGEAVLLDANGGAYFGLNAVGTRVWELIGTTGTSQSELIAALLAEFEVGRDVLENDVADLIGKLLERKLIRVG